MKSNEEVKPQVAASHERCRGCATRIRDQCERGFQPGAAGDGGRPPLCYGNAVLRDGALRRFAGDGKLHGVRAVVRGGGPVAERGWQEAFFLRLDELSRPVSGADFRVWHLTLMLKRTGILVIARGHVLSSSVISVILVDIVMLQPPGCCWPVRFRCRDRR